MDQPLINRIVEGALLASNQPLSLAQLQGLFPEDEPAPPGSVERALEQLREGCSGRGVELVEVASGFRFQITSEVHGWVARLWTERKTRYTRATLETLALIAYRQPITRGEIEQVRGVAVSSNIIQALEEREWIRVVGHRDVPGRPALFGTTRTFLDYFGLKRLDELPPLSELKDLGELEPQLPLGNDGQPAASLTAGAAMPDGEGGDGNAAQADADASAAAMAADEAAGTGASGADDTDTDADTEAAPATADGGDSGDGGSDEDRAADVDAKTDTEIETESDTQGDDADIDSTSDAGSDATENKAREGTPETAPGKRADAVQTAEDNAVATTTVAVDEANDEPEAAHRAGRSQVDE